MTKTLEDIFTSNNDYVSVTQMLVNEYGKFEALHKTLDYKLNNKLNKNKSQLVEQTLQGLHRLCYQK